MDNTNELLQFMKDNDLSIADVMAMTGSAYNTIRLWRCANNGRSIPAAKLELLKLKVQNNKTA